MTVYTKKDNDSDKVYINWWKETHNEIEEELKSLKGTVLLMHNSIEFIDVIDIINSIRPKNFLSVLYISLMRSYDHIRVALENKPLDEKRIFIIDCVTGYAFHPEDNIDNCYYHKPPQSLSEMKKILELGIQKANPDIIIFDSLSRFVNFSNPTESEIYYLSEFLDSIKKDLSNINQSTFILLNDSKMYGVKNLPKKEVYFILSLEMNNHLLLKLF